MSHDIINSWVEKAKNLPAPEDENTGGIQVIRNTYTGSSGNLIMELAEKLRPWLMKMFEGVRDENGMIVQPARVRGIALNVAQDIVKQEKYKKVA